MAQLDVGRFVSCTDAEHDGDEMAAKFEDTVYGKHHAEFVSKLVAARNAAIERKPAAKDAAKVIAVVDSITALLSEIQPDWAE